MSLPAPVPARLEIARVGWPRAGGADQPDRRDWELPRRWLADDARIAAGGRDAASDRTPPATPRGHVVFHDAEAALLFAGDHVLPHITPSIGFEPVRTRLSAAGLSRLVAADAEPSGRPAAAGARTGDRQRARAGHRAARPPRAAAGRHRPRRCAAGAGDRLSRPPGRCRWTRRERGFDELDLFNSMLAVAETSAHLDVLVLQGRLSSHTDQDGVEIYQAAQGQSGGQTSSITSAMEFERPARPERVAADLLGPGGTGEHQDGLQAGLDAGDHVGVHPIADHRGGSPSAPRCG